MRRPALWVVIIAGGRGLRFWPRSRRNRPKPVLALGSRQPLIVETVDRLRGWVPAHRIFISTSESMAGIFQQTLPALPRSQFILEPEGRDTAPGVGLAALLLEKRMARSGADSVLAVLPADHVITRPAAFRRTLAQAARIAAREDVFVTLGIRPTSPSPLFGYLLPAKPYPGVKDAWWLKRFQEKPAPPVARKLIAGGGLWNAGMFLFRPSVLWPALRQHQPAMFAGLARIAAAAGTRREKQVIRDVFPRLQKISFDYAVMEKAEKVAMVRGDFGWTDLGGWDMLYRFQGGDGRKNLGAGRQAALDSRGCYVESRKLVALVGVENLILVETADAILVMARGQAAKLKSLVAMLEAKCLSRYL